MPSIKTVPSEDQEQARLCTWMTKQGIRHFAIPNGGKRNMLEAIKLKRCGVVPGVPDIMVPIPSGIYHGLFIEMKRQLGGKLSSAQLFWLRFLREQGFFADVAHGFDEARHIVTTYLALTPKAA